MADAEEQQDDERLEGEEPEPPAQHQRRCGRLAHVRTLDRRHQES